MVVTVFRTISMRWEEWLRVREFGQRAAGFRTASVIAHKALTDPQCSVASLGCEIHVTERELDRVLDAAQQVGITVYDQTT